MIWTPEQLALFGPDNATHFSALKQFAKSPAHYRCSVDHKIEPTRAMRVGTIVHFLVLGARYDKPLVCYPGERRYGREWEAFERASKHDLPNCEIVTQPEWNDAIPLADKIKAHPVVRQLLDHATGFEIPVTWDMGGIPCATDGLDIVGKFPDGRGFYAELKTTSCAEPSAFERHSAKLFYHAQMAFYDAAAKSKGLDTSGGAFVIAAEAERPWPCTVMRCTPEALGQGERSCTLWLEHLRRCVENNHWPEYTQAILDLGLPPWMGVDYGEQVADD